MLGGGRLPLDTQLHQETLTPSHGGDAAGGCGRRYDPEHSLWDSSMGPVTWMVEREGAMKGRGEGREEGAAWVLHEGLGHSPLALLASPAMTALRRSAPKSWGEDHHLPAAAEADEAAVGCIRKAGVVSSRALRAHCKGCTPQKLGPPCAFVARAAGFWAGGDTASCWPTALGVTRGVGKNGVKGGAAARGAALRPSSATPPARQMGE